MTSQKNLFTGKLNRISYLLRNIISVILFYFLLALNPYLYKSVPSYYYLLIISSLVYATSLIVRRLRDIGLPVRLFVIVLTFGFLGQHPTTQNIFVVQIINLLIMLFLFIYPGKKMRVKKFL